MGVQRIVGQRPESDTVRRAIERAQQFRTRCRAEGAGSVEAHAHEGDKAAVVLHHAHCADLVVIGQSDPAADRAQHRFVEQVLTSNARPTLLVPHGGQVEQFGERVLVAWDDSHCCARAVADALPLLRHAREVHLRLWRHPGEADGTLLQERLVGVQRWLKRQDVAVQAQLVTSDVPPAEAILHSAQTLSADLVVMGVYGHARWAERIVGGVSRSALARTRVPLLMSH